jgi:hypothetical protein
MLRSHFANTILIMPFCFQADSGLAWHCIVVPDVACCVNHTGICGIDKVRQALSHVQIGKL